MEHEILDPSINENLKILCLLIHHLFIIIIEKWFKLFNYFKKNLG